MRITVEIAASDLKQIQKATGQRKKSSAINYALKNFIRQKTLQKIVERVLSGQTDFSLTNEQLEAYEFAVKHQKIGDVMECGGKRSATSLSYGRSVAG